MGDHELLSSGKARTISMPLAWAAITASSVAVSLLAILHVLSPEFDPSWRMVSEYAFGHYGWVLSLMFLTWGVGTWALAGAIWSDVATRGGRVGVWLLLVAGLGEAMASVFDITHDVGHSIAGLLGIGGLPVAALLASRSLDHSEAWVAMRRPRRWAAHLTWVSVVLLIATLALMTAQFARVNGGELPEHAPRSLPAGVIGLGGWANRLIVVSFCAWQIVGGWQAVRVRRKEAASRG